MIKRMKGVRVKEYDANFEPAIFNIMVRKTLKGSLLEIEDVETGMMFILPYGEEKNDKKRP